MAEIVNNDKLTLILTQYGLNRIAAAIADPFLNLNITKIKFGSGDNYEYYTPNATQYSLKGPLDLEFYIYKKELLEDEITISFYTVVPESISGFEIREVGLYETVNGVDQLFAIGTCQPFIKPSVTDNYFISIDYYIFLKAANFSLVYEQISLDPEHALITEPDMEELMKSFLFAHANLINQIGNNSRIIGYNRATQLYEKVKKNKTSFSYLTSYKNYVSFIDTASQNSVFSFWTFDYSKRVGAQNSIVDLSSNANYLSTTIPVTSIERNYEGFMPMLYMSSSKGINFFLDSSVSLQLFDSATGKDIPFVMAFAVKPLDISTDRTLLARSNYATGSQTFEVTEKGRLLEIKLFTNSSNYLVFRSAQNVIPDEAHTLLISYDPAEKEFIAYINSTKISLTKQEVGTYTCMQELPETLYYFSCIPTYIGYADKSSNPTKIYNKDGSPYTGTDWTISNNILKYNNNNTSYSSTDNLVTDQLYAWKYYDGENNHFVYTKVEPTPNGQTLSSYGASLFNADYTPYTGTDFYVNGNIVSYRGNNATYDQTSNPSTFTLYAWKLVENKVEIYGNKQSNPTSFYDIVDNSPVLYTGVDWTATGGHVYYKGQQATYDSTKNKLTNYTPVASYIIDSQSNISNPINSEVGVISIIKDSLSEEKVRALSLLLCATMGINPYVE